MKKKIIIVGMLVTLLIISMFILTGCGKKNENETEEKTETVDETLVKINGLEFHLNKDKSFKDIKYMVSEDFQEADHGNYIQYNYYQEDQTNLFFYRVFYYENKGINDAIADLGLDTNISLTDGKTDNIEYKSYEKPRDDGGTIHFYFILKGDEIYTLNFISKYDIKDFEEKVLNSVKFE